MNRTRLRRFGSSMPWFAQLATSLALALTVGVAGGAPPAKTRIAATQAKSKAPNGVTSTAAAKRRATKTAVKDPYAGALAAYRAKQFAKAYGLLLPLARKKDARAMHLVGVMYQSGQGVPQDDPTAAGWFLGAAQAGNAPGQYALGRITLEGRGVTKDRTQGMTWLEAAASQGHGDAIALLTRLGGTAPPARAAVREPGAPPIAGATSIAAPFPDGPSALAAPSPGLAAPVPPTAPTPAEAGLASGSPLFSAIDPDLARLTLSSFRQALAGTLSTNAPGVPPLAPEQVRRFALHYWQVEAGGDIALAEEFARLARDHAAAFVPLATELAATRQTESVAIGALLIRLAGSPNPALRTGCPGTVLAATQGYAFAWYYGARCLATSDAAQADRWMRSAAAAGHQLARAALGETPLTTPSEPPARR